MSVRFRDGLVAEVDAIEEAWKREAKDPGDIALLDVFVQHR